MQFHTPRLHIRPVNSTDALSMFRYRSDADTHKFLSLIPEAVGDVSDFISRCSAEINVPGTWFQFAVIERDTEKLIGDIGVHFLDADPENRQAEIGYTLDKDFRRKGYATEALTQIIDFLFHDLHKHRITASVDPANTASIRLIERLGFRKEAHFVQSLFFHGEWVDDLVYAVLAKEWDNRSEKHAG